jgi:hypothetical protein
MKGMVITFAVFLLVSSACGQAADSPAQRAAAAVPQLKGKMKDPDSFVLERVYTASVPAIKCDSKWCRHKEHVNVEAVCFTYRSRNSYGGYGSSGGAVLPLEVVAAPLSLWKDKNLHLYERDDRGEFHSIFGDEVVKGCQPKYATGEITEEVNSFMQPGALTPEARAKAAQQYADCLKLAVDNPKVSCSAP